MSQFQSCGERTELDSQTRPNQLASGVFRVPRVWCGRSQGRQFSAARGPRTESTGELTQRGSPLPQPHRRHSRSPPWSSGRPRASRSHKGTHWGKSSYHRGWNRHQGLRPSTWGGRSRRWRHRGSSSPCRGTREVDHRETEGVREAVEEEEEVERSRWDSVGG